MKNVQIFYNCDFCRVGVPVWVESDHVRRDGQGTPTHFPSRAGNAPERFYCITPSTAKTLCCPVSRCYFCFDKSWRFCFSFPARRVLPFSCQAPCLSPPSLSSSWDVRSTYLKLWNLRIWRYFLILTGLHLYRTMLSSPAILLQLQ